MNKITPSPTELSRVIKLRALSVDPVTIEATDLERAALANRFSISGIDSLHATLSLQKLETGISARGQLLASIIQTCAISGEDFPVEIEEELDLLFVEEAKLDQLDELSVNEEGTIEVDLFANDTDEIGYSGDSFDLGEAVAQSLVLAIDPYAEGPNAHIARKKAGLNDEETPSGPLADALADLKRH